MFIFWLFWAENSKLKISLKQRAEQLSKCYSWGAVNFKIRKSNDKIIFKAVVAFRFLAQNQAIIMYGQSCNEDFGKKKGFEQMKL